MRSFFVVRMKKGILRVVTLSINKAFIKPILTILDYKTSIRTWSLCFHSHFYANFHEFYEGQLMCYNFILLFNLFKMAVQYNFSPILMVQMLFSQIQQAPGPDFRMVGKSLPC